MASVRNAESEGATKLYTLKVYKHFTGTLLKNLTTDIKMYWQCQCDGITLTHYRPY